MTQFNKFLVFIFISFPLFSFLCNFKMHGVALWFAKHLFTVKLSLFVTLKICTTIYSLIKQQHHHLQISTRTSHTHIFRTKTWLHHKATMHFHIIKTKFANAFEIKSFHVHRVDFNQRRQNLSKLVVLYF